MDNKMDNSPLVSIIIPVYNGSDFLAEAIDSALSQTYKNIEILVVNDGSADNGETARIAKEYGSRIRYFEKENGGVSSAINMGIREMKGELFSWLSHDDVYLPQKIEMEVEAYLKLSQKKALIYCCDMKIDENSDRISYVSHGYLPEKVLISPEDVLHHMFLNGVFNGCGFLIPKTVFYDVAMFNEELRYAQDALLWYQIFGNGYSLWIEPGVYVKNRMHKNQQTNKHRELFKKDCLEISKIILPLLMEISSKDRNFAYEYTLRNCKLSNYSAVSYCKKFLREHNLVTLSNRINIEFVILLGICRKIVQFFYQRIFLGLRKR